MCRGQLPVWQQYLEKQPDPGFELIAIAADAAPDQIRMWAEKQPLSYPVLIDPDNTLGHAFGFKAVPNGVLLDREGVVRWLQAATFSIKKPEVVAQMEAAVKQLRAPVVAADRGRPDDETEAQRLFREGSERMLRGDSRGAAELWRRASELDPDDFVIRKQLWRALHPDRFGERLDLEWQQEQMQREVQLGRLAANPLP